MVERTDTGDHMGFLLKPFDGESGPWSGQLGFRQVVGIEPGHDAVDDLLEPSRAR